LFLTGLAISFPFGAMLVGAFGPKAAYAVAGAGCAITAVMLWPLLRHESGSATVTTRRSAVTGPG